MSVEKKYLKTKPVCKVKFIVPETLTEGAKSITLAGEFNDWNANATKLRKQKSGDYATTLDLQPGKEYQYRYVIDGERWENDSTADKYVPSNIGDEQNSVVVV
ncbi:MAG: glycoside hydrolase [Alteromonadaceae bacterium]|nr:MAG: glycoside hydrolase [Alteromonadaceae bacterium]